MSNNLEIGSSRLGNLVDFDPDTPHLKVKLERSREGITLSVPWDTADDYYARWFGGAMSGVEKVQPPSRLLFHDHQGAVMLLGCRTRGASSIFWGPGIGTLSADFAVLGSVEDIDFDRVEGLKSEISGLRRWLGVSSVEKVLDRSGQGAPLSVHYTLSNGAPVVIGGPARLRAVPTWFVPQPDEDGRHILHDLVHVDTLYDEAQTWKTHLAGHEALRDLIMLSSWTKESLVLKSVFRLEEREPIEEPDAKRSGIWWAVESSSSVVVESTALSRKHLIKYSDLGADGILRWIGIRADFARAIDPIIASLFAEDPSVTLELVQVCMGLEALAYLLGLREDGLTPQEAARIPFAMRLVRIGDSIRDVVPFDVDVWAVETAHAYNAVKHANREMVDPIDMVNRWRETVLVFRIWIAHNLGVKHDALQERLKGDSMSTSYTFG